MPRFALSPVLYVVNDVTKCWDWQRAKVKGYGRLKVAGRIKQAHRYFYEQFVGPIPDGYQIDHLCKNPGCVNPEHLEPVPPRVNNMRSNSVTAKRARQTHCVHGHPLTGDNVIRTTRGLGGRECRTCNDTRGRKWGSEGKPLVTHCYRGHPYDEQNTYWNRGKRYCRTCQQERHRGRRQHA